MGAHPKCHTQDLHRGGHDYREGHKLGPKGLGPKASGSSMRDARLPPWLRAPNNIVRYTTNELLDNAIQDATNEEAVRTVLVLGGWEAVPHSSRDAPSNIIVQGSKKGTKGGKKRQKWHTRWVAVMVGYNDDDDKKVDGFKKEYAMAAEHGIKRQARLPIDHFERLLEIACPNHAYPVKHKLKDCDMVKNFMTSGFLTRSKETEGDPGGKGTTPFPGKESVMTLYDRHPLRGAVYLT
jgi:hypothetical protein